jgi:hypothetical protein
MKHLKHTYQTSKTLKTCAFNTGKHGARWFQPLGSELAPHEHHHNHHHHRSLHRVWLGRVGDAHDGRERAAQDGHAAAVRQSGRATSRWEGRGWRRPPRWRRPAVGGQRGGCTRGGHMRATVGNGKRRCVFFLEKPCHPEGGAEEVYWARSLDRSGNEPSGWNTPGRTPCASIIVYESFSSWAGGWNIVTLY